MHLTMAINTSMSWEDDEQRELIADEGKESKSYKDTKGNWTIGIGHFLGPNPIFSNVTWTDEQIENAFDEDFQTAVTQAEVYFPAFPGLDGPRKGALVNMVFEMGGPTVGTFHSFLHLLDLGQYSDAADDLSKTAYAKQVPARAGRIIYRIRTGLYANR